MGTKQKGSLKGFTPLKNLFTVSNENKTKAPPK
jgi:hypothetical protein